MSYQRKLLRIEGELRKSYKRHNISQNGSLHITHFLLPELNTPIFEGILVDNDDRNERRHDEPHHEEVEGQHGLPEGGQRSVQEALFGLQHLPTAVEAPGGHLTGPGVGDAFADLKRKSQGKGFCEGLIFFYCILFFCISCHFFE